MGDRAAPRFYVRVRVGGAEPVEVGDGITGFRFEDDETKTDKLTLSVNNYDCAALDGPLWVPDNVVEFQFGYPGRMSPPREAVIQKVTGFATLQVECDSKDSLMNRRQRTDRTWLNVKRSAVVREIVGGYGFTDDLLHIEDTELVVPSVTQARMTDLQLIKSLAAREGFEFFVDFDGVHFHKRNTKQKPIRTLTYFADPGLGDITNASMEVEKRAGKPGAVTLAGKDAVTGEPFKVTADNQSTAGERTALASHTEVAGPDDQVVESIDAFGNSSTTVSSGVATSTTPSQQELVAPTSEASAAAAQRVANGAYEKQQLRGATLTFTTVLDPLLFAKATLRIEGVGKKLSGNWYVKHVVHDVYAATTSLKLAREGLNGQGAAVAAGKNDSKSAGSGDAGGPGGTADGSTALEPVETIDAFGSSSTTFRDTGGRGT
jgi:hypothetical protein